MLISVKHNLVFLCTPKCASVSIEASLRPYSDILLVGPPFFRHTNYRLYNKYIKPYIEETARKKSLETICLIREPLSWLNSWYRFRSRLQLRDPNHPNHKCCTSGIQFSTFIEAYMAPNPPPFADVGSQFDFIKNETNEIGVDKIFLYENIGDFAKYMSHKVGEDLKVKYKNVSPKKLYKSNLVALTEYVKRRIINKLNLNNSISVLKVEYEISDDLVSSLRNFISNDFELYEMLKSSHKRL